MPLKDIHKFATDGESKKQLDQLFTLVECQLGYPIFEAIENSKIAICTDSIDPHHFAYSYPGIKISEDIPLTKYHNAMTEIVDDIIGTMMDVFEQSGIKPEQVDEVVLTGGTAQFTKIQEE